MKKTKFNLFVVILIVINIILSAWYVLHQNILFHTDIARDFLVMQTIVETHRPTLLGPSSGIPGFFHGPLWFFVNLPAYILAGGNPIGVGWVWVFLSAINILVTYYFSKKLFNEKVAILTALLTSVFSISYTNGLLNPYGAVMLFLPFFYFFVNYIKSSKLNYLVIALLLLGCIVQFEIAFGAPILILATIYAILHIVKSKKFNHLFAFFILLIPFSSYIIFDLRHNYLQVRAVASFFSAPQVGNQPFVTTLFSRLQGLLFNGLNVPFYNVLISMPVTLLFIYIFYKFLNKKFKFYKEFYLFFYFYIGFWILMIFYSGVVWNYIYWPFSALIFLMISSMVGFIDRRVFAVIFIYIYCLFLNAGIGNIAHVGSGWKTYHNIARTMYKDATGHEFGYFVYSPDLLGYSEKFAIKYTQKEFPKTISHSDKKMNLTYLTVAPPPPDRLFLNADWWRSHQVNIQKNPTMIFRQADGIKIEKYILDGQDLQTGSDPNLVNDLIFR